MMKQSALSKKYVAANEFISTFMSALSTLCKLAQSESQREELASILRKTRIVYETPTAMIIASKYLPHIESYSERIIARDEAFLSTVNIRTECANLGVTLDESDNSLVMLFNSFRENYVRGDGAIKNMIYDHILSIHNAAMVYGQLQWV